MLTIFTADTPDAELAGLGVRKDGPKLYSVIENGKSTLTHLTLEQANGYVLGREYSELTRKYAETINLAVLKEAEKKFFEKGRRCRDLAIKQKTQSKHNPSSDSTHDSGRN